ncbi:hypothetical protein STA3757_00770 [Stanieria sp. NIES-3757]|nr:hypothetical protein STA3757_00770 [Stanieria sp. NIES-3757]
MLNNQINRFFFTSDSRLTSKLSLFWLGLSLTFAILYSWLALQQAFSSEYVIQDDARQHIFWMRRFLDSELFPNDLIANYFQSVAPFGYTFLYRTVAAIGIDPGVFSKLIPGILGIITTVYCFAVTLELLPLPFAGFVAALLLNQNLWMQDGFISGTPKAFISPLLLIFFYYWLRQSLFGICLGIILLGLFYPSLVFICAGLLLLQLWRFEGFSLQLSRRKQDYFFCFIGLGVAFITLLPFAISTSEFSPTITVAQARELPEFNFGERAGFFNDRNPWDFWFNGSRSSIRIPSALMPPLAYLALFLPILLKFPKTFTLSQKISSKINTLPRILLVSLGMFCLAHLLLFTFHLPSRYTQHTLRIVVILSASLAFTLIWNYLLSQVNNQLNQTSNFKKFIYLSLAFILGIVLLIYPFFAKSFVWTRYISGNPPELYHFLEQQPKDIVIATLADEGNNIPSFARRSILVSSEYAIPYHWGYYRQFRQKALDLIQAQYNSNRAEVNRFIQKYKIDFWLIERNSFNPEYIEDNKWIRQHQPVAQQAVKSLKQGNIPILESEQNSCVAWQDERYILIDTNCWLTTTVKS